MLSQGVDMIDVGAYSTRPGASDVSVDEELGRLAPALEVIRDIAPDVIVSVDTFRAEVAREAVQNLKSILSMTFLVDNLTTICLKLLPSCECLMC